MIDVELDGRETGHATIVVLVVLVAARVLRALRLQRRLQTGLRRKRITHAQFERERRDAGNFVASLRKHTGAAVASTVCRDTTAVGAVRERKWTLKRGVDPACDECVIESVVRAIELH